MTINLAKNHRKDAEASVLAIAPKSNKLTPDYFDSETHKAIASFLANKKLDSIKAYPLTIATSTGIHSIIICSVGTSKWDNYQMEKWTQAVLAALEVTGAKKVDIDLESLVRATKTIESKQLVAEISQLILHHQYQCTLYKSNAPRSTALSVSLLSADYDAATRHQLNQAKAIDQGTTLARTLANMPANACDVNYLVDSARQLAKDSKVSLKLIDEKRMEKLEMGAFLAVTRGSTQEGKIIILEYKGADTKAPFHAVIGKGLVFDSGGISLKPAAGMEEMKYDMCGAASVLGACQAIIALKAKINVLFVVAAAENMPSGMATRPGDIVKTCEGLTVEILNTDAEGRLVLCDTISYIKKQYKPQSIVDIATLTGACVVALGHHASALYANDENLSDKLQKAGQSSHDKVWPMPLWQEYQDQLDSNIADLPNISGGRDAGSITAACFLSRFAKGVAWAHLDIAGTGWKSGKNKQATGRPTALLTHYLLDQK